MNTRKFTCPFCNFTKNFYGKEAKKYRKRVAGFTCPKCKRKVTDDDIRRKRGRGPKPKDQRRKRVKKEVVEETPIIVAPQPVVEQFVWRAGGLPPPGNPRRYPVRAGWSPKPQQPTDRTLEEVLVEAHLSKPKRRRTR